MRNVFLPRNLNELWEILEKESAPALYAGGTDLLVNLRAGLFSPSALVCIERLGELRGVREQGEAVWIGAATTHSQLLEDPIVEKHFPILTRCLSVLGSPPIRHMGTLGGNIVTASPAGDSLPALHVLGADVEVVSAHGSRRLSIRDFVKGPGMVAIEKGEVVRGVWLRPDSRWNVHHYEKVGRRKAQACAVASMAALVDLAQDRIIRAIRLAWGSVGPVVVESEGVEAALIGRPLCPEVLSEVRPLVEQAVSPIDDIRATAAYRRTVAGALVLRLLEYRDERA